MKSKMKLKITTHFDYIPAGCEAYLDFASYLYNRDILGNENSIGEQRLSEIRDLFNGCFVNKWGVMFYSVEHHDYYVFFFEDGKPTNSGVCGNYIVCKEAFDTHTNIEREVEKEQREANMTIAEVASCIVEKDMSSRDSMKFIQREWESNSLGMKRTEFYLAVSKSMYDLLFKNSDE